MKRVALVFVLAVLAPSLVLAWLAVRSVRDQQFLLERQQSLLDQGITDALARNISDYLAQQQQAFSAQVESLAGVGDSQTLAAQFDDQLRQRWPLADVGFCVTAAGKILSPLPNARPSAQMFRLDNSGFLGNREPVEVYFNANNFNANPPNANGGGNAGLNSSWNFGRGQASQASLAPNNPSGNATTLQSPAQPRQQPELTTVRDLNAPVAAANAAPGQAFTLKGNTVRITSRSQANQISFAINGSSANSTGFASGFGPPPQQQLASGAQTDSDRASGPSQEESSLDGGTSPGRRYGGASNDNAAQKDAAGQSPASGALNYRAAQSRKVSPQSQVFQSVEKSAAESTGDDSQNNLSKVIPAEAEFRQLIGDQTDGILARFLQNKLKLMCWHRLSAQPDLIFGAQLNLDRVVEGLRGLVQPERSWGDEICLAVLDDNAHPVVVSRTAFQANWKRPFVATEVGDALPHWEAAAYLLNPAQLTQAAHTASLTLGLLVAVLLIAIGIGSLLIVRSLGAELKLARQKTDFVGNVSHELKTPLTSIRMFSELLAEGRVADPAKQRSYLQIITAEAARLTRLINNVLDFSRLERGEKKYNFQPCELTDLVRATAETFRPHLESTGFQFACELPAVPVFVHGDADALSQVIVNLLSNAEKYSGHPEPRPAARLDSKSDQTSVPEPGAPPREILLHLAQKQSPLPYAEIKVLDRGPGVPRGCEEKVFEKFYRAHDSLSSGIQGSGLGLTIARQIARAHGGDVGYETRDGGGSCFVLRLPISSTPPVCG